VDLCSCAGSVWSTTTRTWVHGSMLPQCWYFLWPVFLAAKFGKPLKQALCSIFFSLIHSHSIECLSLTVNQLQQQHSLLTFNVYCIAVGKAYLTTVNKSVLDIWSQNSLNYKVWHFYSSWLMYCRSYSEKQNVHLLCEHCVEFNSLSRATNV